METIKQRIKYIINQYYSGSKSLFIADTKIRQGTLNDIISGRGNNPSANTINKILNVNTVNINPDWLMTGTGEVLKSNPKEYKPNERLTIINENDIRTYSCLACIEKEKRIEALCEALRSKTETIECLRENIDFLKGKSSLTVAAS